LSVEYAGFAGGDMAQAVKKQASYEDLFDLPDNMVGEIIDGELIATPRPSRKHSVATSVLGAEILPPYQFRRGGGPGGWMILFEPEISIGPNILVPDLAGWRKERFPASEETNWISVAPDWACEVLSPKTVGLDKVRKMPIYARHGIGHLWLVDPASQTLDVFRLESGRWLLLGSFCQNDMVRAEPFQEIEIELGNLWLEESCKGS
jgi:Uma2 family endonuclease